MKNNDVAKYLSGEELYGDDLSSDQISIWVSEEEEAYANLGAKDSSNYTYEYHAWNTLLGYKHLSNINFENVLGFGSAYGEELLPIVSKIRNVTIVDPSGAFVRKDIQGIPVTYVKPSITGSLPFESESFDLITCFGVLHHIPNVTYVFEELARVLKPGGALVLREPIVSMGDWRESRPGLTKHERGIPLHILDKILDRCKLLILRRTLCGFPLTERIFRFIKRDFYNSSLAVWIDAKISAAFSWNINYHPRNLFQQFRPTSVFLVLYKPQVTPI